RRAHAERGNLDPLDDAMRVALEQVAVFVNARLTLFGIDQQELLRSGGVAGGFPLRADRKVRTAAAAQARGFDELPYTIATERKGLLQRLVWPRCVRIDAAEIGAQARRAGLYPAPGVGAIDHRPGEAAIARADPDCAPLTRQAAPRHTRVAPLSGAVSLKSG